MTGGAAASMPGDGAADLKVEVGKEVEILSHDRAETAVQMLPGLTASEYAAKAYSNGCWRGELLDGRNRARVRRAPA